MFLAGDGPERDPGRLWCRGRSGRARCRQRSARARWADLLANCPAAACGLPSGLRDAALLELLYACGLRANEACTVRVTDLDRHKWMLRVLGKGGKQRLVPVGRAAADALEGISGARAPAAREAPRPPSPCS